MDQAMLLPNSSNNGTCQDFHITCCLVDPSSLISIMFYAFLNLLLLPLYLLVLFVSFKQWQQQQGGFSGMGTSDILTLNLALIETIGSLSAVSFAGSSWAKSGSALKASFCLFVMYFFGEAMFHCGICVDRYLAIAHPITYRNLKEARAILARNVIFVVCWLCVASWIPFVLNLFPEFSARELVMAIVFYNVIVMYCCLSALYLLTRPGPNGTKQIDQIKLRAFHIISVITCLLFFKMVGILTYLCLYILAPLKPGLLCVTLLSAVIIITPVNTLIPLLFLRRMKQTLRFR